MTYIRPSKIGFLTDSKGVPSSTRVTLFGGFFVAAIIALSGVYLPNVDRSFCSQMVLMFLGVPSAAKVVQKTVEEKPQQ